MVQNLYTEWPWKWSCFRIYLPIIIINWIGRVLKLSPCIAPDQQDNIDQNTTLMCWQAWIYGVLICLIFLLKYSKAVLIVWDNQYYKWSFLHCYAATYFWLLPSSSKNTSFCLSVCLSVCHTFALCSCHRIITKFSGVINNDRSDVHTKD